MARERNGGSARVLAALARAVRRLWGAAGVALLIVVLAELAAERVPDPVDPERAGRAKPPREEDADGYADAPWARAYFEEFEAAHRMRWEPHVGLRRKAFEGEFIHVDERGLRRTWNAPAGDGAARILVFGGSTVWGTGARDDHTIPSCLSRALHEAGFDVQVVNMGESSFTSTQGLIGLMRRLQQDEPPDLVVFYDGVNEISSLRFTGEAGVTMQELEFEEGIQLARNSRRLRLAALRNILDDAFELADRWTAPPAPRWADDPGWREQGIAAAARVYAGNVRMLGALAREFGFTAVAYLQPLVLTRRAPSPSERAVIAAIPDEKREFYAEAYRRLAGSRTLAATGLFRDLTHVLDDVPESLFIDYCHLVERGNERIAAIMAADLAPRLSAWRRDG